MMFGSARKPEEQMETSDADRNEAVCGPPGHECFSVPLTESDLRTIHGFSTARKAEWIVCKYIGDTFGAEVVIEKDHEGADLRVSRNGRTERIEVKGTAREDIAWPLLKVSSRQSHDALTSGAAAMWRVTGVGGSEPRVHVLKHGRDYELQPEPRWAVRPAGTSPYPLRGRRYRYELPHEGVALNEWDVHG